MKLTGVLTLVPLLHLSASVYSQQVTLKGQRVKIKDALRSVTKQTGYGFLYNSRMLDLESSIAIDLNNAPLSKAMEEILDAKGLTYKIEEKTIVLLQKPANNSGYVSLIRQEGIIIKGKITDENGKPLVGATVQVEGQKLGCTCGNNGEFELKVPKEGVNLVVSFVGYEKKIVKAKNGMTIVLASSGKIEEVTISTGYFNRTKESATGSQIVVTGEDLRKVGALNLMQALNAFDPSVRVAPNLEFGSDPNRVPDITVRGENGFDLRSSADDSRSNPNSPLYLLDGIEVSATRIYDLDMNRIESFAILRDASATSLYGSRGANGVIIITTIPPKEGAVRVSFNANSNVSIPDLRDYNLMNSSEKLEYERLAGLYSGFGREEQILLDIQYNERLAEIARGVDTYWLSKPLTTSVNQRYNVFVEGGG